jgi:hypothetical protein
MNFMMKKNDSRANQSVEPVREGEGHVLQRGKLTVMSQLATHCPPAATESAAALIRFGRVSPSSTQVTGPHDMPKAITNRLAAMSAIGP